MNKLMLILLLLPALAIAADGTLQVQTQAQKEVTVVTDEGEEQTRLVPVTTVVPGDEVIYTITFTNVGDQVAQAITITDPVPAEMRYIDGTAFSAGAELQFSVDGGDSWGVAEELIVSDAEGKPRPAQASDYTHIRWVMRHPIKPGQRGYARFKAALR
ncbi:MAG: DUF11 domain-containing protein [Gammaproteobacteria bacterium]|nr:DUF11 domain-containing protein [Gammaproteobacteria bacterium]NND60297.1 DUF11 domain-containing protein [Gammaproteobacteria bacterium]